VQAKNKDVKVNKILIVYSVKKILWCRVQDFIIEIGSPAICESEVVIFCFKYLRSLFDVC